MSENPRVHTFGAFFSIKTYFLHFVFIELKSLMGNYYAHYKYVTNIGQSVKKLTPPDPTGPRNEKNEVAYRNL